MQHFGLDNLYLSPEYLDSVSIFSSALVGVAVAIFMMCWNITTFILYSQQILFLATTSQPFLKYCINNAVLPIIFLLFYAYKSFDHDYYQELFSVGEILLLIAGFLVGFIFAIIIAFGYFFGADKTIYRFLSPTVKDELQRYKTLYDSHDNPKRKNGLRVDWYFSATFKLRKPRDVGHYTQEFIEALFKQHHLASIISILIAFGSLIGIGYWMDNPYFQLPAAASITMFFALFIAVAGAFSYFLKAWAIAFFLFLLVAFNWLYEHNVLDPRNKVYGLNYDNPVSRPHYDRDALSTLASSENITKDSLAFISILENWKVRQKEKAPVMYIVATSGGGTRAATFTMDVLQQLDSITTEKLMPQTMLITGASGGMLGACYFRELYWQQQLGKPIQLRSQKYVDNISKDLLNPVASSLIARDLLGPAQYFTVNDRKYIKDRGYALEQKLSYNTHGLLNKQLKDYALPERQAQIPLIFFNSTITLDGRRLSISTRPARFMMRPFFDTSQQNQVDPDALDFFSFFEQQDPGNIRILTALRMNATFPYVLPSVWLPTKPVIDVMDAGFRDNTGAETAIRFINVFSKWMKQNCGKVVLLQIRDKKEGAWEDSTTSTKDIWDLITTPALLTQNNLFRFQEFAQHEELQYFQQVMGKQFYRVVFQYEPTNKDAAASLSFHLTQREKIDVKASLQNKENTAAFEKIKMLNRN